MEIGDVWKYVNEKALRLELGREFQNELARTTKDFSTCAVLLEGIYKLDG